MILNSIELENIRSYTNENIQFPKGITLFEGDIGSGKSSVLMAIEFALFGLGSQKPEALLSKKATDGSVTLSFEVDGTKYEIKRSLKRKGNSVSQDAKNSYLQSNGQSEPLSPTELKQRVLQILNFNEPGDPRAVSRIFRYAVFTPQEEMKQILRDSTIRLETIRRAFGVEDYKTAAENAKVLSSALKTQMAVFEERYSKLSEDTDELKQMKTSHKNLEKLLLKLEQNKNNFQSQVKQLEKERDSVLKKEKNKIKLESELQNFQSKIKSNEDLIESYEGQIQENQDEIAEIKSELSDIKKIKKPTEKTLDEIEKEISRGSKIRDKVITLESKRENLDSEVENLQKFLGPATKFTENYCNEEIKKYQQNLDKASNELEKVEKLIEKQKEIKIKSESQISIIKEKLDKVAKLGAKCPYCDHKLTKEHIKKLEKERKELLLKNEKILKDSKKNLEELEFEQEKIDEQISVNGDAITKIERYLPDLKDLHLKSNELTVIQKELKVAQSQILISEEKFFPNEDRFDNSVAYLRGLKDILIEYQNASKQTKELQRRQEKAKIAFDISKSQKVQIEEKNLELTKDIKSLETDLQSFVGLDGEIENNHTMLEEKNRELSKIKETIAGNNANLKNYDERITQIEQQISEAEKWKKKNRKFSNYYDWFKEFFIPTVEQIEKQVLLSIQQNFNEIYRRWYSILIDDSTKESRIDEEFSPIIEQDGYEQDVDYLSGGEKTSIALAYRLTLNSMMRQETDSLKSNLLILDEPTDGFSKTQLSKVRDVLQELKSQQIILVSHEKELETYVDNIFQITKQEGISQVVRLSN